MVALGLAGGEGLDNDGFLAVYNYIHKCVYEKERERILLGY